MSMRHGSPGSESGPFDPEIIFRTRGDGTATAVSPVSSSAWTLAQEHDNVYANRRIGLIDVCNYDFISLWVLPIWNASATALQLQIRSLIPLKSAGDGLSLSDGASVAGSALLTSAGSNASLTLEKFVGLYAAISGGTNSLPGVYQIAAANVGTNLELSEACDDGVGNMSGANIDILAESQECALEASAGSGTINVYPATFNLAKASFTTNRWYHFSVPVAAARYIRTYVKSAGADMAAAIAFTRGINV